MHLNDSIDTEFGKWQSKVPLVKALDIIELYFRRLTSNAYMLLITCFGCLKNNIVSFDVFFNQTYNIVSFIFVKIINVTNYVKLKHTSSAEFQYCTNLWSTFETCSSNFWLFSITLTWLQLLNFKLHGISVFNTFDWNRSVWLKQTMCPLQISLLRRRCFIVFFTDDLTHYVFACTYSTH